MTKKDYEAIAREIRVTMTGYRELAVNEDFGAGARVAIRDMAIGLANVFGAQNPRFDREKFLIACGVR